MERARKEGAKLPTAHAKLFESCTEVLEQTKKKVQEVEALIHYCVLKPGREANLEVSRFYFLQERDRLVQLQMELRNSRQRISIFSGYFGITEASKIQVLLKDIQNSSIATREDILNALFALDEGQAKVEEKLGQILDAQSASQAPDDKRTRAIVSLEGSALESVQVSVVRMSYQIPGPKCRCHRRRMSTNFLSNCLGSLSLRYTAVVVDRQRRKLCFCVPKGELLFTYHFPKRIIDLILSLRAGYCGHFNLTFSLSVAQRLPSGHSLWAMVHEGDIDGLQRLFSEGKISIGVENCNGTGAFLVRPAKTC